jgi:hypothetical protein
MFAERTAMLQRGVVGDVVEMIYWKFVRAAKERASPRPPALTLPPQTNAPLMTIYADHSAANP